MTIRVDGTRRQLAHGVDRAAYRILQEALTNAARHGGGKAVAEIDYGRDALELTVTNPATGEGLSQDGHGIVGMRERTTLLGGTLEAGASGGNFRVRASLPYGGGERRG
ncbi:MAG: hypothetical protein MSC30_19700 [Gaiellaceae bacterium MAG52_C11]|nr:hypothetical protein [Candidatus Gaiellasilicea maunaloa]